MIFLIFGAICNIFAMHIMYIFTFTSSDWDWSLLLTYWAGSGFMIALYFFLSNTNKPSKGKHIYTYYALSKVWYLIYSLLYVIISFIDTGMANYSIVGSIPMLGALFATVALLFVLFFVRINKNMFLL